MAIRRTFLCETRDDFFLTSQYARAEGDFIFVGCDLFVDVERERDKLRDVLTDAQFVLEELGCTGDIMREIREALRQGETQ